ncbi:hypothetical protein FSP39_015592 [Pinctada imbricata]|uniref:Dolichyl-diphosphooligosaccharide--protein glycosyltransferase subunit KCP2 n=1 Tax=Pinctada imbricata TaxID=66713 RepID=A0AA88YB85_PINIB|nr:hypothetical protein FSP39_015592 [Pinctada imbricata]
MTSQSMTLPRNTEPEVTGVQLTSYSNVSETQDVIPGLKQECTKLVMELNREMAQYSILLVVVGGGQDSCEVREELKSARRRIFDLANQSMTRLVPVLKRSRVCSEEMKELERLYNMMSSCMDLFEIEMNRTLLLQRIFPDAKIQVKTGVFEFHGNCSKCQRLGSNWNIGKEEMEVLERDVADLHSTLDIINRTIALQPWADDSDVKVIKSDKAVSSGPSAVLSLTVSLILFAGMQMFKQQLAATEYMTIVGGFIGSLLFIFVLTGVSNTETALFGHSFQTKLFPEVMLCLAVSMFASGLVHRVCVTTCFIFSLVALYYINKISQSKYSFPVSATPVKATPGKKRK